VAWIDAEVDEVMELENLDSLPLYSNKENNTANLPRCTTELSTLTPRTTCVDYLIQVPNH
jgi:hypothetical protein